VQRKSKNIQAEKYFLYQAFELFFKPTLKKPRITRAVQV
jgi:hypothetical protein